MKKVLEVNVDDNNNGGVYSLVKNYVTLKKRSDIQVDIAAIERFEKKENIEELHKYGCSVFFVGFDGNKIIKQIKCYQNIRKLVQNKHYDCVHIHADVANKMIASGLAAKKCGVKKIILHSHAAGIDGNNRNLKLIFHKISRRFLKNIGTNFVACSDVAAKWMYPNISLSKVKIVRNGIDLKKFSFNNEIRKKVKNDLGLNNAFVIGHVGRFCYQKNHEFIVKIFNEVTKLDPTARLLLVGEGPDKGKIENLVKEYNLQDKVIFFGISDNVNELMQAMDVFILPSHFEGLPIVGVEAQAAGLPVVFSDKITREAQLLNSTCYVPINDESITLWVNKILHYKNQKRVNTYNILKSEGFDYSDMVTDFNNIYLN